jgi:large subunit ribosomal protein L20
MARVKGGFRPHLRHKKVLKEAKGRRGAYHLLYRRAHEGMLHALWYAYRDRRNRRRDLRRLWIARINAAARQNGLSYSRLMHGLKQANVTLDRRALADLAVRDPQAFAKVAETARNAP